MFNGFLGGIGPMPSSGLLGDPQLTPSAPLQLPQMPAPQVAPPPPPMTAHQNLLGRIHDYFTGGANAPSGYDQVLSPDDIRSARPSLLQALLGHDALTPQQQYEQNLNDLVNRHAAVAGVQRQQQALAAKQAIMKANPAPTSGSEADMLTWANRVYPQLVASGNIDDAKEIGSVIDKLEMARAQRQNRYQAVQTGDQVMTFDPQTGTYTPGPQRGIPQAQLDENAQNRALREQSLENGRLNIQLSKLRLDEAQAQKTASAFATQNKPFTDASAAYVTAKAALQQALTNPGAAKSAILDFAKAADSSPRISMNTINYIRQIDPSFTGNVEAWAQRVTRGTIPANQIGMLNSVLDAIHSSHAAEYERRRAGMVAKQPGADAYIPNTQDVFGVSPAIAPTAPVSGANKVRALIKP